MIIESRGRYAKVVVMYFLLHRTLHKYEEAEKILVRIWNKIGIFPNRLGRNSRRIVIKNSGAEGI